MVKTRVDVLLDRLNLGSVNNDEEFLNCLIELDNRVSEIERIYSKINRHDENQLLEKLAELEHIQWEHWSKHITNELHDIKVLCYAGNTTEAIQKLNSMLQRWEKNWKPYKKLKEDIKDYDREWARKVLELIKN